jgi:aminopeptidase-like protein
MARQITKVARPKAAPTKLTEQTIPVVTDWKAAIESVLPSEARLEEYFDRLWPICRSITGDGFRSSLKILSEIAGYQITEIASGTQVFDWTIPREWNIEDAYVEDEQGRRVIDFRQSNLHVVNYSSPVDQWFTLDELQKHLYSLPEMPSAIPYLTTYYSERWGFCLSEDQRRTLQPGRYHAVIKSSLKNGHLTIGEKVLPAAPSNAKAAEILLSSYLCHPSMANNELSGPLVTTFLHDCLRRLQPRRFTYRFVIVPETIGSIAYLSRRGKELKQTLHAGLVATCVGDDRQIRYQRSRRGDAIIDRIAEVELAAYGKPYEIWDYRPNGSDERQYCSPGFNLPVGSLMRSTYDTYREYHTSLDNKSFISFGALRESIALYLRLLLATELNETYVSTIVHCEPRFGKRGLYPSLGSEREKMRFVHNMMWIVNQSDGTNDLCTIARKAGLSVLELAPIASLLAEKGLLRRRRPAQGKAWAIGSIDGS